MKNKLAPLVASLIAATYTFPSSAIQLYKDELNTVDLRGYVALVYVNSDEKDEINEAASRWGFDINRKVRYGWNAGLTLEWGLNFDNNANLSIGGNGQAAQGSADDALFSRLGYVRFEHDKWGNIGIGKQWAVFYDVVGGTDILNYWGGSASGAYNLGSDGGISGVGRAEQAITWRKTYSNFAIGLQVQSQDESVEIDVTEDNPLFDQLDGTDIATMGNGYGASVSYNIHDFSLAVGHNVAEIDINENLAKSTDDIITSGSITYGRANQPGLYFSANYGQSENHEIDDEGHYFDAEHLEVLAGYTIDNGIFIFGGLNNLQPDDSDYLDEYELKYSFIGVEYPLFDAVGKIFLETRFEDSTSAAGKNNSDTQYAVGVRVYL